MNCNKIERPHDSFCFACGAENDFGLKLKYQIIKEGKVTTTFTPESQYQSYENTFHGGMQALVLDACMVQAIRSIGHAGVTGKMEIHYKKQVILGREITINATVCSMRGDFIFVNSEIVQEQVKVATASGVYKKLENKK